MGTLLKDGSTLYGMTSTGGDNDWGELFQYDLKDNKYTILYSFAFGTADGQSPEGSLVLSGSQLYGTTLYGGTSDYGAVFQYDLSTGTETLLHSFNGEDGTYPKGSLIVSENTLYGMTGGGGNTYLSSGVIFSLTMPEPPRGGVTALVAMGLLGLIRRRPLT